MFRRIILAVALTASCIAQEKKPNENIARMEQIIQANVPKQFMGTVLVAQDGKIVLDKGYGFANLEWEIPNTRRQNSAWDRLPNSSRLRRFCCWKSGAS